MGGKSKTFIQVFILCTTLCHFASSTPITNEQQQFDNALDYFGKNIFSEISKTKNNSNIIVSPFSIQTCLAMTRMGADGGTADEMDKVLGFDNLSPESVAQNFHSILAKYEKSDILKLANKVYVAKGLELLQEYNQVLSEKFFSSADSLDFADTDNSVKVVNDWVANKTENMIVDFMPPKSLSPDAVLVLLSAIYFQGQWKKPFNPAHTKEAEFFIDDNHSVQWPMMQGFKRSEYARYKDLEASALRLPYKDSDISMMIILPNSRNGLSALMEKLKNTQLKTLTQSLRFHGASIDVSLPKFKAELKLDLKEVLQKMNLNSIFSHPNFSKMFSNPGDLKVEKVIHQAVIEVDEVGTKAAAVTLLEAVTLSMPIEFKANHPFYYVIMNSDAVPLFEGTFMGV
ncbi:antichymotrypsin-2 [Stomoxys calcitrans]|uniref:antichymotrypsin-2 n=1 Tax=Stomoxys calcitrans TaxID=35570 RepID=UPI0027E2AF10|nr:antichymotrypsin-2 [Stomoxys calcitrans]